VRLPIALSSDHLGRGCADDCQATVNYLHFILLARRLAMGSRIAVAVDQPFGPCSQQGRERGVCPSANFTFTNRPPQQQWQAVAGETIGMTR
jgi:hypothetical protein